MTTTPTDAESLYAGVLAEPDCDVRRLVYADALEEAGDGKRAEFIRVQIELERHNPCDDCLRKQKTHSGTGTAICVNKACQMIRCAELLDAHETTWRRAGPCAKCGVSGNAVVPCRDCIHWKGRVPRDCRCSGTRREPCPACFGTGDKGGLLAEWTVDERHDAGLLKGVERLKYPVAFRRGFPASVSCTLADVIEQTRHRVYPRDQWGPAEYETSWTVTPWARAVVAHHPVTAFEVMDREADKHSGSWRWWWQMGSQDATVSNLPSPVYEETVLTGNKGERYFPTAEAATLALAQALARLARRP